MKRTDVQKMLCEEASDRDSESGSPSLLISPRSPSPLSASPQFESPDIDRYSQDLFHPPPPPATSPESFSASSPEIEFSPSAPDGVLLTLYRVDSKTTTTARTGVLVEAESDEMEDSQLSPGQGTPSGSRDDRGEEGEDEFDGWIHSGFIKVVKTAVLHLLNETIKKFMVECCYGCTVDHPSLRQHQCKDVLEDDFFERHYCVLMRRLYNGRFTASIQHLLTARNIREDDGRVRAVAESYLYELTLIKQIITPIHDMYEQLIGEDVKKLQQLQTMTKFWEG